MEAARLQANSTARPNGYTKPTPDEMWNAGTPVSEEERKPILVTYRKLEIEVRGLYGIFDDRELPREKQAMIDREAIVRALVEHDLLLYRKRRITLPIIDHKVPRIA